MLEPMTVWVEVWPVAADEASLWLVSGNDAWRSGPVMADSEPHAELELSLHTHGALDHVRLLHSTSWRVDGPRVILTYVAVVHPGGPVRSAWPEALPIGLDLANAVGKPFTNAPVDPPTPRYIDVLLHGIRHLRFLLDTDATNAAALDHHWRRFLANLQPALARMYDQEHEVGEGARAIPE